MRAAPNQGFSYVEILLSVVLLALLITPALQALQTATMGSGVEAAAAGSLALNSKMEEVLAAPFSKLYGETYVTGGNTATSVSTLFSDAAGAADRRVVVIYRYDSAAKALSTSDTGLALVNVYYETEDATRGLTTLRGRWW